MRKCPRCQNTFDDDLNFCLNDGTVLETVSANDEVPTVFIPASFVTTRAKKPSDSQIYLIIGLMTVIILSLTVFVIYLMNADTSPNEPETAEGQNATASPGNKKVRETNINSTSTSANTSELTGKISEESVRNLINKWEQAQENKNIIVYRNCYGQPFTGIKRTKKSSSTYDYTGWMKDRSQMISKAFNLSIEIKDLQISIDEDIATVTFEQIYRSASYSDRGPKVIKVKKFPDGEKIIYEELKNSYPLN